jgi:hypothetical protein
MVMAFLDTNAKRARQAVEKEEKLLGDLGSCAEISLGKAESLEVLGRLHALEVERFYERRRLEWRLAFTLWLGLAGVGAIVVNNLSEDAHGWWVFGASVVFAVLISVLHALLPFRPPSFLVPREHPRDAVVIAT